MGIERNRAMRDAERAEFYQLAFDYLADTGVAGDYAEFGCHKAVTFRMALAEADAQGLADMKFLAFDSFAGLPALSAHDVHPKWQAGALTTTVQEFWDLIGNPVVGAAGWPHVRLYPGFYSDTLPGLALDRPIAFACIDCDLYESARDVLKFIDDKLAPGAVVYLDDWFPSSRGDPTKGVVKAWGEFMSQRWEFVPHLSCGWWGRSFLTVPAGARRWQPAVS